MTLHGAAPRRDSAYLYQPANGGLDSAARRYAGFVSDQVRMLRPARPTLLSVAPGDLINFVNVDGATPVVLIPIAANGDCDYSVIGLEANPRSLRSLDFSDLQTVSQWMRARGGQLPETEAGLPVVAVFDDTTAAGEAFSLRLSAPATLWIMIDPAHVADPERVMYGGMAGAVSYQHVKSGPESGALPEPFGDVREEFTIPRGTARAYTLKPGETVQIIDVEGRQCSDFMAMNARALDTGRERFIDSTVTRSMVHGAYPTPGLFDKFYDQDMQPLLKLMQDTVGRHDTFALACTARGYEERGFFGHLNCSDNISRAFLPYGIAERRAWPAINFFFNSWIDPSDNQIQTDEAWSRPGDYVALQAMTDLVAVSTACPDDVDPINGWNPTDVHVRIYSASTPIRHAVAYRSEPDREPILTEHSAFHPRTRELTRHFAVARDLWLPQSYEATRGLEEYEACRTAVTVQDLSSLRKFDVLGPDAESLLQQALTRDVTKLALNRGVYALMCDDTGSVIDDGTLFRLGQDTFRWCCGSDDSGIQLKKLAENSTLNVWIKSLYGSLPNLAIQGPRSRELVKRITFTQPHMSDVEQLKWFGSTIGRLYDRDGHAFQLTRSGYTGELGYEIFCHPDSAIPIWDAVMNAGADLGVTPMGLEALETIRIEAGLMAANAEFGPDIDVFESGLGFAVDLSKPDFIGKSALQRNHETPRRLLKGIKLDGQEVPVHGDPVMCGRRQVGVVTSATLSPELGCAIAMVRLAVEHATVGEALEVGKLDGYSKRLAGVCCDIPFVDPSRSRARA